jgi:hypothetical protein
VVAPRRLARPDRRGSTLASSTGSSAGATEPRSWRLGGWCAGPTSSSARPACARPGDFAPCLHRARRLRGPSATRVSRWSCVVRRGGSSRRGCSTARSPSDGVPTKLPRRPPKKSRCSGFGTAPIASFRCSSIPSSASRSTRSISRRTRSSRWSAGSPCATGSTSSPATGRSHRWVASRGRPPARSPASAPLPPRRGRAHRARPRGRARRGRVRGSSTEPCRAHPNLACCARRAARHRLLAAAGRSRSCGARRSAARPVVGERRRAPSALTQGRIGFHASSIGGALATVTRSRADREDHRPGGDATSIVAALARNACEAPLGTTPPKQPAPPVRRGGPKRRRGRWERGGSRRLGVEDPMRSPRCASVRPGRSGWAGRASPRGLARPSGELRAAGSFTAWCRGLGGVAEWSKAAVLKTAVGQPTRGSNPFSSVCLRGFGCRRRSG